MWAAFLVLQLVGYSISYLTVDRSCSVLERGKAVRAKSHRGNLQANEQLTEFRVVTDWLLKVIICALCAKKYAR